MYTIQICIYTTDLHLFLTISHSCLDAYFFVRTFSFALIYLQNSNHQSSQVAVCQQFYIQWECIYKGVGSYLYNFKRVRSVFYRVERYTILTPMLLLTCSFDSVFLTRRAVKRTSGFTCQHSDMILLNAYRICKNKKEFLFNLSDRQE